MSLPNLDRGGLLGSHAGNPAGDTGAPTGLMVRGAYYFAMDANDKALAITDSTGAVKNQYRYSPYGVGELATETFFNPLRYAAREWDPDAGLYYNRARWYDPQLQRFISQDPIGIERGLNLYAYAGNDPVNASDPSGLMTCVRVRGNTAIIPGATASTPGYWECDSWGMPVSDFEDLRMLYGTQCTTLGICADEREKCLSDSKAKKYHCMFRYPTPEEWIEFGKRLDRIPRKLAACRGAAENLQPLYDRGRTSGGILFWDGIWYTHWPANPQLLAYPSGTLTKPITFFAFDSRWVFEDATVIPHEPMHLWVDANMSRIPAKYQFNREGFVEMMDDVCASRP